MKIVKVYGGLGNQMFQYAFYYALCKYYIAEDIYIDNSSYLTYKLHNGFELGNIYKLSYLVADKSKINKLSRYFSNYKVSRFARFFLRKKKTEYVEKNDYLFDSNVFNLSTDVYYEGYWQNELYFNKFRNELVNLFKIEIVDEINKDFLSNIIATNSISIHVRRGDYLNHPLFEGICDLDYYVKSINFVFSNCSNPVFYIFSNDISWCQKNILPLLKGQRVYFIDWNTDAKSYIDMHLMKHCKVNIIANSSFSWWAAWLNENKDKIIIAPKVWTNGRYNNLIQLSSWIKI